MVSLEAGDETSVPLSLRDPTSYVLCYGMQHDAEATRQQHEAYMAVVHKIIQREDAARALLLSVNVLSTSVISSQLTMYRWKVTEVRTVAQATATLLDEIMDASRKGYKVERRRAKPMGVSRFADGQGLQELYERKMRKIARHRERRARRLQARHAGRAATEKPASPGHPFAATLPASTASSKTAAAADKTPDNNTTNNSSNSFVTNKNSSAENVEEDDGGGSSSSSEDAYEGSVSSAADGTSRAASRRGQASNASGRGMAHFTRTTPTPPRVRSTSLCSAEEDTNNEEGGGGNKAVRSKNAEEAAARRRPPPDALTRLVIVDSYTHEPLEDIIQHIRYIDQEYGLELIVVLLLPARQEAAVAQGAGVVLLPQHDTLTIASAYAAGYDLVLPHCFDHVAASFFTEMFLSSAGRWRNDVRAKAAVGNYVSLKNILLGNVDLDTLRQLARNGGAGDGMEEAQLLETLGQHSLALQGETKRYSVAMQHLNEEHSRGRADVLVLDGGEEGEMSGGAEGPLLPSALARFPRHAMPRNGVRCVEPTTASPLQHLNSQADMLDTYMNPTSQSKHAVRRLRRGPNGQPLRSTSDDPNGAEDEEGNYEYVMVDENEEHRAALTTAFEKELSRLIAENDEKNAELAYMQNEMDKLQRTVTVLKRMQNMHYGNGSFTGGDDDANNNGELDGRNALFDMFEQAQQQQQQGPQDSGIGGSLVNLTKEQQIYILKERLEAANERVTSLLAEDHRGSSGRGHRSSSPQSGGRTGSLSSPGGNRLLRHSFLAGGANAAGRGRGGGRGATGAAPGGGLHSLLLQLRRGGRRQLERHEQAAMQLHDTDAAAWEGMGFGASVNDAGDEDAAAKNGHPNKKGKERQNAAEMLRRRRQDAAAQRLREQEQTDSLISALQDQLAELRGASASGTYHNSSSSRHSASRGRSRRRRHGRRLGSSHGGEESETDTANAENERHLLSSGNRSEMNASEVGALDLNGLRGRLEEAVERLTAQRQRIQQLEEARQIDTTVFTTQLRRLQLQLEGRGSVSSNTTVNTAASQATSKKSGGNSKKRGGGGGRGGARANASGTRGNAPARNATTTPRRASPAARTSLTANEGVSAAAHAQAMDELRAQLTQEAEAQRVTALRAQAREHERTMLRCERTVRGELEKLFLKLTKPQDSPAYVELLRHDHESAAQGMNEVARRMNFLLESAGLAANELQTGEALVTTNAGAAELGWRAQRQDKALRARVTALAREYAVYALRAERAREALRAATTQQQQQQNNDHNNTNACTGNVIAHVTLAEALARRQRCQAVLREAQEEGDSLAHYVQAMVDFVKAEEKVVEAAGPDLTATLFATQQQVSSAPRTLGLPLKDLPVVSTEHLLDAQADVMAFVNNPSSSSSRSNSTSPESEAVVMWPDAHNVLEPVLNIYNAIVQANLRIRRQKPRLRHVTLSPTSSQAGDVGSQASKRSRALRSKAALAAKEEEAEEKALAERELATRKELLSAFEHHSGLMPQLQAAPISETQRQLYQAALVQYQRGHLHPDRMMDIEQQATQGPSLTSTLTMDGSESGTAAPHAAQAELAGLYLAHHQELLLLLQHLAERYPMLHELTQAYGTESITGALKQEWGSWHAGRAAPSGQATSVPFLVTIDTALLTCAIDCLRAAASVTAGGGEGGDGDGEEGSAPAGRITSKERSGEGDAGVADFFLTASPKYRPHTVPRWHSSENAYEDVSPGKKEGGGESGHAVTIVPHRAAGETEGEGEENEEDRALRHLPRQHTLVRQYERLLTGDVRRSTATRRKRQLKKKQAAAAAAEYGEEEDGAPLQLLRDAQPAGPRRRRRRRHRRGSAESDEAAMEGRGLLALVHSGSEDEEEDEEEEDDSMLALYESDTTSNNTTSSTAGRRGGAGGMDRERKEKEGTAMSRRVLGALKQRQGSQVSSSRPAARPRNVRRSTGNTTNDEDDEAYLFSGLQSSSEAGYFAEDIAALFSQKRYGSQPVSVSPEEFYLEQAFEDELQHCTSSEKLLQARSIRDELNYLAELRQARLAELRAHVTAMRAERLQKAAAAAAANEEGDQAEAILHALQGNAEGESDEGQQARLSGEFEVKSGSPAWYGMEAAKRVKDILRRRTKPDQIILGGGPNGGDVGIELSRRTAFPLPPPREMEVMQSAQERLRAAHAALPPVNLRGLTRWQRRRRQLYTSNNNNNNGGTNGVGTPGDFYMSGFAGPYVAPRDAMSLNAYDAVVDTFAFDGAGRFYDAPAALLRRLQSYQDVLAQAASRISAHGNTGNEVARRLGPPFTLPLRVGGLQPTAPTSFGGVAQPGEGNNTRNASTATSLTPAGRSMTPRSPLPNTTSVIYGLPVERVEEMLHTAEEKPDTVLFLPPRPCSPARLGSRAQRPASQAAMQRAALGNMYEGGGRGGMNEFYAAYGGQAMMGVRSEFSSPAALAAQRLTALLQISMQDATIGALRGHALHMHPRQAAPRTAMTNTMTGTRPAQPRSSVSDTRHNSVVHSNSILAGGSMSAMNNNNSNNNNSAAVGASRTSVAEAARRSTPSVNISAPPSMSQASGSTATTASPSPPPPPATAGVRAAIVRNDVQEQRRDEEDDEDEDEAHGEADGPLNVRFDRTLPPTS